MNSDSGNYTRPTWYRQYLCGGSSAFFSVLVVYPIHKSIFRQQLYGVRWKNAVLQLWHEGPRLLYRGVAPPLLQKTISLTLMFGVYGQLSDLLIMYSSPNVSQRTLKACAAFSAGCLEAVLLTPFERVQTLLQDSAHNGSFRNTSHTFKKLLHSFGPLELYRGMVPVLVRNGPSTVLYFSLRDRLETVISPTAPTSHMIQDFVCGCLIGALCSTIVYPVNVAKTHIQSRLGGSFKPGLCRTLWLLSQERGAFVTLYRGGLPNAVRAMLSWGIITAVHSFLDRHLPP